MNCSSGFPARLLTLFIFSNSACQGPIIRIHPSHGQDSNDLVHLLRRELARALVHVDIALLQDQVAEATSDPLDLRDCVHHLHWLH